MLCDTAKRAIRRLVAGMSLVFLVHAAPCGAKDSGGPLFRHGINITRLFDTPRMQNGAYARPAFAPWTTQLSQSNLQNLRDAGFDFIRLPVDPGPFLELPAAERKAALAGLFDFLALATKDGFSVIVDLHPRPASAQWSPHAILSAPDGQKIGLYRAFAATLGAQLQKLNANKLALELMNEPQSQCIATSGTDWTVVQRGLYSAVRNAAAGLKIFVTGGCNSSIDGLSSFDIRPMVDSNLYVMVHFYEPFAFTHQGAPWSPFVRYNAGLRYPVDPRDRAAVETATRLWIAEKKDVSGALYPVALQQADRQIETYFAKPMNKSVMAARFGLVAQWADAMRLPRDHIVVGEFGVMDEGGGLGNTPDAQAARAAWLHDVASSSAAAGFGWAVWAYEGAFGIASDQGRLDPTLTRALLAR